MTYDHGILILMAPSRRHERIAEILGRLVFAWTKDRQVACLSGGSTTMKSRLLDRGLEPDKCFYIQNEAAVRDRDEYDADIDPPPDLVIEVHVTSSSTTRMPVYAGFHVPASMCRKSGGRLKIAWKSIISQTLPMSSWSTQRHCLNSRLSLHPGFWKCVLRWMKPTLCDGFVLQFLSS